MAGSVRIFSFAYKNTPRYVTKYPIRWQTTAHSLIVRQRIQDNFAWRWWKENRSSTQKGSYCLLATTTTTTTTASNSISNSPRKN